MSIFTKLFLGSPYLVCYLLFDVDQITAGKTAKGASSQSVLLFKQGMRWDDIAIVGGGERCKQGMARKPEESIQLGRPRHEWVDNIKKEFKLIC